MNTEDLSEENLSQYDLDSDASDLRSVFILFLFFFFFFFFSFSFSFSLFCFRIFFLTFTIRKKRDPKKALSASLEDHSQIEGNQTLKKKKERMEKRKRRRKREKKMRKRKKRKKAIEVIL